MKVSGFFQDYEIKSCVLKYDNSNLSFPMLNYPEIKSVINHKNHNLFAYFILRFVPVLRFILNHFLFSLTYFQVLPTTIELISKTDRFHRQFDPDSSALVIGIPNVGKSSLINLIRNGTLRVKGKALKTGNKPGVTRALQTKIRVSDDPLVYLLDTPGIMMPNIANLEVGMKLASCGKY